MRPMSTEIPAKTSYKAPWSKSLMNRPVFLGQMVECIHAAAPVPRRF